MPDIDCITPDWSAPAHVKVYSTTRSGGVSQPPFESLNLGLHVADDPAAVATNRQHLARALGLPAAPRWLQQVHGHTVLSIDESTIHDELIADGAFTSRLDRVAVVMTADCLPVVITDAAGSQLAVVHAGWRGLAAGVLQSALRAFSNDAVLHAWFGPAIGPEAFEVGPEVRQAFIERDDGHADAFIASNPVRSNPVRSNPVASNPVASNPVASNPVAGNPARIDPASGRDSIAQAPARSASAPAVGGTYLANLYQLARRELDIGQTSRGGCIETTGGDHCTFTESDRFHSHRRDGIRSGRMATLAWLASS